jgi:predicted amidophosphoribosyltransferase
MDVNDEKKEFRKVTIAKICSKCDSLSQVDANFCRYCGASLSEEKGIICPNCSKYVDDLDVDACPYCDEPFTEKGIICPYCSEFTHIENQENETYCEHCGKKIRNLSDKVIVKVSRISERIE